MRRWQVCVPAIVLTVSVLCPVMAKDQGERSFGAKALVQREDTPMTPAALKPAPAEVLPIIEAQRVFPRTYDRIQTEGAQLGFAVEGERFTVKSRFSVPEGRWESGPNHFFSHHREVKENDEWIEVRDTFRNRTRENLPIMQEHSCALGQGL